MAAQRPVAAEQKKKRIKKGNADFAILIVTLVLVLFGIVMVFSASYYYADVKFGDGQYFFRKQVIGAVVGLAAMLILMNYDYKKLFKFAKAGIIASIVLLAVIFIPGVGVELNEASRWINIFGFQFQPAEVAKFALILYFAAMLTKKQKVIGDLKQGFLPLLCVYGIIAVLILMQPNFSTLVCISLLVCVMMWMGGAKRWHLIVLVVVGLIGGVLLIASSPYRTIRYTVFLDPWKDPQKTGYQLIQSLYGIGAGGLFGAGFGNSQQKLLFLPYGESDFIFSIIAEELGLVIVIALILLYLYLVVRGIRAAMRCPDLFGSLIAAGISTIIAIQVLVNIGVATGSIPPTGLPLPFVSAGSSSLLFFMASIGILLNISRRGEKG
ncbi:MAG: putative lipid II flippase FtsW [Christensenellales bacterium]